MKKSKVRPGIRKSYMDDLLKRGTAMRDKHKANTWSSVGYVCGLLLHLSRLNGTHTALYQ